MASIPVTIQGVLFYTGLEVGGGPIPGGPGGSPGQPPTIWPSPGVPTHPIAPGGPPPTIWPSPGVPTHPIAPGGPPPQIWGGPYFPPTIWPNPPEGQAPIPSHPIVLPPDLPPTLPPPDNRPVEWKAVWVPGPGWAVIGIPQGPTPTPSAT